MLSPLVQLITSGHAMMCKVLALKTAYTAVTGQLATLASSVSGGSKLVYCASSS